MSAHPEPVEGSAAAAAARPVGLQGARGGYSIRRLSGLFATGLGGRSLVEDSSGYHVEGGGGLQSPGEADGFTWTLARHPFPVPCSPFPAGRPPQPRIPRRRRLGIPRGRGSQPAIARRGRWFHLDPGPAPVPRSLFPVPGRQAPPNPASLVEDALGCHLEGGVGLHSLFGITGFIRTLARRPIPVPRSLFPVPGRRPSPGMPPDPRQPMAADPSSKGPRVILDRCPGLMN